MQQPPVPPTALTQEVLLDRLVLRSGRLIEELLSISRAQLQAEETRDAGLNGKATAMLGASGLSLSVVTAFGAVVLHRQGPWSAVGPLWLYAVTGLFALALLMGFAAALTALVAMRVTGFVAVNDEVIFSARSLADSERPFGKTHADTPHEVDAADAEALKRFQRYCILHLWEIRKQTFSRLERKAGWVLLSQTFFGIFIVALTSMGLTLAVRALLNIGVVPAAG